MSDELKPCPFCGGSEIYAEEYEHHPGAVRWRVFCAGCMAGVDTGTRQSMGQAVQDWNRRAERACLAKPYEVDGETGFYDCIECECGEVNDVSARYCNGCGGLLEVVYE